MSDLIRNPEDLFAYIAARIVNSRFAIVIVGSESSSRAIFDKLPKKDIHGQTPMVTHCNKQSLNQFEAQARKGEPPPPQQQQNGMGKYICLVTCN